MFSRDAAWERSHLEQGLGKNQGPPVVPSHLLLSLLLVSCWEPGGAGISSLLPPTLSPRLFLSPRCSGDGARAGG